MLLIDTRFTFLGTLTEGEPPTIFREGEREAVEHIESTIRDLYHRYGPQKAPRANLHARNVRQENAAVDAYIQKREQILGVLGRLEIDNEWKRYFPDDEHPRIREVLRLLKRWRTA